MSEAAALPGPDPETDLEYSVSACVNDHVHIELTVGGKSVGLVLSPEDAYELAHTILRDGYDEAVGIAGLPSSRR